MTGDQEGPEEHARQGVGVEELFEDVSKTDQVVKEQERMSGGVVEELPERIVLVAETNTQGKSQGHKRKRAVSKRAVKRKRDGQEEVKEKEKTHGGNQEQNRKKTVSKKRAVAGKRDGQEEVKEKKKTQGGSQGQKRKRTASKRAVKRKRDGQEEVKQKK